MLDAKRGDARAPVQLRGPVVGQVHGMEGRSSLHRNVSPPVLRYEEFRTNNRRCLRRQILLVQVQGLAAEGAGVVGDPQRPGHHRVPYYRVPYPRWMIHVSRRPLYLSLYPCH